MPRRRPVSGKQHKAELQLKRAVKRGDIPPTGPSSVQQPTNRKQKRVRTDSTCRPLPISTASDTANIESSRRLQSAFLKLPPKFLEESKNLATSLTLPRPVPLQAAIFDEKTYYVSKSQEGSLVCPKRPKWKYDMTKKEVEKNEEGLFNKWLKSTDEVLGKWQKGLTKADRADSDGEEVEDNIKEMPRSPTYFERNLEVWRQL
jgi:hypothetical protein